MTVQLSFLREARLRLFSDLSIQIYILFRKDLFLAIITSLLLGHIELSFILAHQAMDLRLHISVKDPVMSLLNALCQLGAVYWNWKSLYLC